MTKKQAETKPRRLSKAERLHDLVLTRYEPRMATKWPYLMRGEEQFKFEGPDRRRLLADLRAAWRERYPDEAPPAAQDLNAAVEDLRRLAERTDPDPVGSRGRGRRPRRGSRHQRGPARPGAEPGDPAGRLPAPGRLRHPRAVHRRAGRHPPDERRRGRVYPRRLVMAVPRPRLRRPGRRPAGRACLARRAQVGLPAHPPRGHQERPQARHRGRGRGPARHRGRGQAGRALAGRGRGRQPCGDSTAAGRPAARLAGRREDVRHRAGHALAGRAAVLRPGRRAGRASARMAPSRPGKTPSRRPATTSSSRSARTRDSPPRCCTRSGSTRSPSTSPAGRPAARPSRRWSR